MYGKRHLAIALLVMTGLATGAAAATDGDLKPVLQARYATMKAAMAAHDGKAISALLAPDFVSVEVSGQTVTGAQMISGVAALPPDPNKVSQTTLLSVTANGNTATVDQRYDMKTVKTGTDGVTKNIELVTLSTDTWIKSGGAWLIQRSVTKQIDYFVNGISVAHKTSASAP